MPRKKEVRILESYEDFVDRTGYQKAELQLGEGDFTPDKRVLEKVSPDNRLCPFYGDTVVFDLDDRTKEKVAALIGQLYAAAPECFSERLRADTIHMTLHDLSASANLEEVAPETFRNEVALMKLLHDNPLQPQTIKMRSHFIINMVNTSLVLALRPADKEEWNKLQALYDLINRVKVCPYPFLTPHITLAYFNRNGFDEAAAQRLCQAVYPMNQKHFGITLRTSRLYYQKFTGMNDYINVARLT